MIIQNSNAQNTVTVSENFIEIRELLTFFFDLQRAVTASLAGDGKIDFRDLGNFLPMFASAGPAFKNLGNPLARYTNLTQDERALLLAFAKENFALENQNLEHLIEDSLDALAEVGKIVRRWGPYLKPKK